MQADLALASAVRHGLAELADPDRAEGMRAYLKSELPCRGVTVPARRRMIRDVFAAHPLADADTWTATVLELWRPAAYREERHAAIDLTGWPAYAGWQTPDVLPLYEELVVTGAWWDLVDEVAIRRIGPLLRGYPDAVAPVIRAWARDPDRWRRRTAVICQVGAKAATDVALLAEVIESNAADRDFFLRKGIGWALREHAKTDPAWVAAFAGGHALSPLSRREALKHLGGTAAPTGVPAR
jgi:3-methyladenine DNA glycosylase AlkD